MFRFFRKFRLINGATNALLQLGIDASERKQIMEAARASSAIDDMVDLPFPMNNSLRSVAIAAKGTMIMFVITEDEYLANLFGVLLEAMMAQIELEADSSLASSIIDAFVADAWPVGEELKEMAA
ncbi:hypothetical protein J4N45_14495 [Vibrio sp. SCSIO 43140]|uniref:hypothetical protein n=1 Tax=Vibrio sp. SCSIO 43140 TaxID=2819100 RepID=UPI002076305B|nr:hypothetical protein [Vibrio sp. SCSIO 43140]USD58802.1 hypothetical protein J4N45_09690 [Vibrio sp. SCSIO 43140]USD59136.1 hypothetical protein J4N45_11395 [Vibrio sp. SCSIO 43140]USD59711.1 hypothetical protein J4N45_14495 [Vibrio sp. SCSIO 43140]